MGSKEFLSMDIEMITMFGQMKKSLRQRMKVISLSWFIFEQKLMMFSKTHLDNAPKNARYSSD